MIDARGSEGNGGSNALQANGSHAESSRSKSVPIIPTLEQKAQFEKTGVQYVGTTGTTRKQAVAEIMEWDKI